MPDPHFSGLILPSAELAADVEQGLTVCDNFEIKDIDDYKSLLIPENDPETWLRKERQVRNDCQGNSLTSCIEVIEQRTRKRRGELARTFAYQMSEKYDGRGIGNDAGSSIHSGVKVACDIGLPLETEYTYEPYVRGDAAFKARCTSAVMLSAATRKAVRYTKAPAFRVMLAHLLLGHPLHWGTWWPLNFNSNRVLEKYVGNYGDGGHAYFGAFPHLAKTGQWLLKLGNSHGDGYFWFTEEAYEEARDPRNTPFGAYLLYGNDHPLDAHYHPEKYDLM